MFLRVKAKNNLVVLSECSAFGWDRVNFPHSSWYGPTFWICVEKIVAHAEML